MNPVPSRGALSLQQRRLLCALLLGAWLFLPPGVAAQENFEIQVYESETVAPGKTIVELHTNMAAKGTTHKVDGVLPTQHATHATLEITRGFTPWFETAFYLFTSIQPETGWEWVGDHVRPRLRVPESWEWPVGLGLSAEIGYPQRRFSTDTWTVEIRPIVDERVGPWYFSLNPVVGKAL